MSLHRVRQRLARMLAEHEEGERDGHAPTAQAHATLAAHLREDIAAIDEARDALAKIERERDEPIARAERAEAQLAALRMAADRIATIAVIPYSDKGNAASAAYNDAIRDTAAAAEAYTRRVRAEALREAAKALRKEAGHPEPEDGEVAAGVMRAAGRLLEMAIEIERGGAR